MNVFVIGNTRALVAATICIAGALFQAAPISVAGGLSAVELRCEYRRNPLGIDVAAARLSWQLESGLRNQRQSGYHVLVSSSVEKLVRDEGDLWDSGRVSTNDSLDIVYGGKPLQSGQACFWKVRVWDQDGQVSAWSQFATWEMALLQPEDWKARWINDGKENPEQDDDFYADDPAPLFRKEFQLPKPVRRARLYVTGLGYYEARLNGSRVGDQLLDPGWTDYKKRVLYSTYDVTSELRSGTNCIGVTLGNGWWNPLPLKMWGRLNLRASLAVGRPRFLAQLMIEFVDGSSQWVGSDLSWKVADGPIRFNNIYLGEVYDARKELAGWDLAGFDDSAWRSAKTALEKIGPMQAQPLPPIRITERFPAVRVTEPEPGVYIYDLGQNFSGWASFRFREPSGKKIVLRYGELLNPDGSLNPLTSVCGQIKGRRKRQSSPASAPTNSRAPTVAWQTDTYIAKGTGEEFYQPSFTFHGFRYVEVRGLSKALPLEAVEGFQLGSDVANTGEFACSKELLNEIQLMCRRTFRANLFSVQSDCPHRERFGYGGDIVATSDALMMNFDMSGFYAKAASDWADSERLDGVLGDTAPHVGLQYCGMGWSMAYPLLVRNSYRYYGNQRLVEEQYDGAKRWLLHITAKTPSGIITEGLSDHESLTPTPAPPLVTPLYYQSARMLGDMAAALGRTNDVAEFAAIAATIRNAYQQRFLEDSTGRIGPGTQASQSFALYSDLVPPERIAKTLAVLVDDIRTQHDGHLTTGIMGTKFMLEVLSRNGYAETAYGMVAKTNYPGWGWMLANGATTLWESWKLSTDTFTHDHPMFGSVSQWFIQWLGGIQPDYDAVGFDRIVIRPQTVKGLNWVRSSYHSARGPIISNWQRQNGRLYFAIKVPANTTAQIHLPSQTPHLIMEGGKLVGKVPGISFIRVDSGATIYSIGSGQYQFELPE